MPLIKEVVEIMIGEKECKKLDAVSLSNNIMDMSISLSNNIMDMDMSNDVLQQIVHQVKKSPLDSIEQIHRYSMPSTAFCVHSLHQQGNYIRGFLILQSIKIAYKG